MRLLKIIGKNNALLLISFVLVLSCERPPCIIDHNKVQLCLNQNWQLQKLKDNEIAVVDGSEWKLINDQTNESIRIIVRNVEHTTFDDYIDITNINFFIESLNNRYKEVEILKIVESPLHSIIEFSTNNRSKYHYISSKIWDGTILKFFYDKGEIIDLANDESKGEYYFNKLKFK